MRTVRWMSTPGLLGATLALLLSACSDGPIATVPGDTGPTDTASDAGCTSPSTPCGEECCLPSEQCHEGECVTCVPTCAPDDCGDDGCGGQCGPCPQSPYPTSCNDQHKCVCAPESDEALCARQKSGTAQRCGDVVATDNCGLERIVTCGCTAPEECDDASFTCICRPEDDAALCAQRNAECGTFDTTDRCGEPRAVTCTAKECQEPELCLGNRCICPAEPDEEVCGANGLDCGSSMAKDHCGTLRSINCGDALSACGDEKYCVEGTCGSARPPSNDSCSGAKELRFGGELAIVDVDTSLAADDSRGSMALGTCGDGRDVVFHFETTTPSYFRAIAAPSMPEVRPVLYLLSDCADPQTQFGGLNGCHRALAVDQAATIEVPLLPAGNWYLWIDSQSSQGGAEGSGWLTLSALLHPWERPRNEACAAASDLPPPNEENVIQLVGATVAAASSAQGPCEIEGGSVYYRLTTGQQSSALITVISKTKEFVPTLALFPESCERETYDDALCESALHANPFEPVKLAIPMLEPEEAYLLRIGRAFGTADGVFELQVLFGEPVLNAECPGTLIDLSVDPGTPREFTGDTRFSNSSFAASCSGGKDRGDVVFQIKMPEGTIGRDLHIVLKADDARSSPVLVLREQCAHGAELLCAGGGAGSVNIDEYLFRASAPTYSLVVDSLYETNNEYILRNTEGPFRLQVSAPARGEPPANDLCSLASATLLEPAAPTWTILLPDETTRFSGDEYAAAGTTHSSGDVFYTFVAPQRSGFSVTVRPKGNPSLRPMVTLTRDCAQGAPAEASVLYGFAASSIDEGRWFIAVDGVDGTEGAFSLEVSLFPLPIENFTCDEAELLSFSGTPLKAHVVSTTQVGNFNQQISKCNNEDFQSTRELVWRLVVPETASAPLMDLTAKLTPLEGWPFIPNLSLRADCADAFEPSGRECALGEGDGQAITITSRKLPRGSTWFVWVDGLYNGSLSDGPFMLDLTLTPSAIEQNDLCAGAIPLPATSDGTVIQGNTILGSSQLEAICGHEAVGGDLYYSIMLPELSNLHIRLNPKSGSALLPRLSIRTGCGDETQLDCEASKYLHTPLVLDVRKQSGLVYIVVDSASYFNEGAFELSVRVTPYGDPDPHDLCAAAKPLLFGVAEGTVRVDRDSTDNANDNYVGSCTSDGAPHNGGDLVYSVSALGPSRLTATVVRAANAPVSFQPALYLTRGDCSGLPGELGPNLACANAISGLATVSAHVESGLWFVVVDGVDRSSGPFSLEVSIAPEASLPDNCLYAKPVDLSLSATQSVVFRESTRSASNNASSYFPSLDRVYGDGPDLVYALSLDAPMHLSAKLEFADDTGRAVLYARSICDSAATEALLGASQAPRGGPAFLEMNVAEAGTIFLWVDSNRPLAGDFELTIDISEPPSPPAASTCDATIPHITLGGSGTSFVDSTRMAPASTFEGGCGEAKGGEAIYFIEIEQGREVSLNIEVTPGASANPGFLPVVYLRTDCGDATSEVACGSWEYRDDLGRSAAVAKLSLASAPGYFLFIDGLAAGGDDYSVEITTGQPVTNDCALAPSLTFDASDHAEFSAKLDGTSSIFDINCGGASSSPGPDAVWQIEVTSTQASASKDLLVTAAFEWSQATTLIVRSAGCDSGEAQVCNASWSGATVRIPGVTAKTYWIIVDSRAMWTSGMLTGSVDIVPNGGQPPEHTPCNEAIALPLDVNGNGHLMTDFDGAIDGGSTSCSPYSSQVDRVFTLAFTSLPVVVDILATPTNGPGATLGLSLDLQRGCGDPFSSVTCNNAPLQGSPALLSAELTGSASVSSPAIFYLWVDAIAGSADEPFALDVVSRPVVQEPDTCAMADARPFGTLVPGAPLFIGGTLAPTGQTLANDASGSCQGALTASGPEVIYQFHLESAQAITADLALRNPYSYGFNNPTLYLRGPSCASSEPENELGCVVGENQRAHLFLPSLPAGTWYLFVDAPDADSVDAFSLVLTAEAPFSPAENAQCDEVAPTQHLSFNTLGRAALNGIEIATGRGNSTGSCSIPWTDLLSAGPELVYAMDLEANRRVSLSLAAEGADFAPFLYVRRACDAESEVICAAPSEPYARQLSLTFRTDDSPALQRYYLFVDSQSAYARGTFHLDAVVVPIAPPPANDRCAEPFPDSARLSFVNGSAWTSGRVEEANNDTRGSCAAEMPGPDRVFQFTLGATSRLRARVLTDGFSPALYVRSHCDDVGEVTPEACAGRDSHSEASLDLAALEAGTYFIWVDAFETGPLGTFWLDLVASAPLPTPSNDQCDNAEPLLFSGWPLTAVVNTSSTPAPHLGPAHDDGTGDCASMPGPDMVYTFNVEASTPRYFTAMLTSGQSTEVALYLTSSCSSNSFGANGCRVAEARYPSPSAILEVPYLPEGTWYLWVDSTRAGDARAFELKATLDSSWDSPPITASCLSSALSLGKGLHTVPFPADFASRTSIASASCRYTNGPEAIYMLSFATPMDVKIDLVDITGWNGGFGPWGGFDGAIYLRSDCGHSSAQGEMGCSSAEWGPPNSLHYPNLLGTYFLFVDALSGGANTSGIELRISVTDPI